MRVFHWLLAASFAGAFLTAESERVRDVHVALGYTFAGLLAFRLVWGAVGSRYARFASFAFGPAAVVAYLKSLLARRPQHHVGHNPAGSWVIYALVVLGMAIGASGYAVYDDAGGKWMESLHEGAANAMLALVIVHIAGVVVSSFAHRENLVAAMVTGYKNGSPHESIGRTRWATAVALAAAVGMFWGAALEAPSVVAGTGQATMTKDTGHAQPSRPQGRRHDG